MPADAPLRAPKRRKKKSTTTRGPQGLPQASGGTVKRPRVVPSGGLVHQVTATTRAQAPALRRAAKRQEQRKARRQANRVGLNPDRYTVPLDTPSVEKAVMEARLRYLRRTGRTGGQAIRLNRLASLVDPKNVYVEGTGAGPTLFRVTKSGFATIKPPAPRVLYAGRAPAGRLVSDLLNFPAQSVVSGVQLADAGVSAAKGDPSKLKAIGKSINRTDPLFNLAAAGVEAVTGGDPGKRLRRAAKAADAHPGFALLEAAGAKGTVGRVAGRVGRSGALGPTVRQAASTAREPAVLEGTSLSVNRRYSRDISKKAMQVRAERRQTRRAASLRARAEEVRGSGHPDAVERAADLDRKARQVDPKIVKPAEIRRRIDERVQLNEDVRRENRTLVQRAVRKALKHVKVHERPIVSLVAQAIVKPTREDLNAYMRELEREYPKLDRAGKRANREIRRRIKSALDHDVDFTRVVRAAKLYKETLDPLQKSLVDHGFLDPAQAEKAALIPYAIRHMGATHDAEKGLLDVSGDPLTSAQIKAHMDGAGVDHPTFLTQAPGQRGAKNFAIPSERGTPAVRRLRRTGEATRRGTFDIHPDTLPEGAARAQGLVDAAEGFWGAIGEVGLRGKSGKLQTFKSYKQAETHLRNRGLDGEQQWRAVRVLPMSARREQLHDALEHMNSDEMMNGTAADASPAVQAMMDALQGKGSGDWALIPEEAAQQLASHLKSYGSTPMGKAGQAVGQAFRKTVLATSLTWATGNTVEAALRTMLDRAGPRSYVTFKRSLKELEKTDPQAARDLRHRAVGGGHFGTVGRTDIHRSADQFIGSKLHPLAKGLERFWKTPGPHLAAKVWHLYTDVAFGATRWVESQFQQAMGGKFIREHLLDDRLHKLSKDAMAEAARGLRNTGTQVEMGRAVDRAYGRYSKWSPEARLFITAYTPFIAWTRAAALFVVDVLPRDHPTTTAMIAVLENANAEWRKERGLNVMGKGRLPGFLQGSTPTKGGGHQRAPFRYTPFGAFGDPLDTVAGGFLPQFSSVIKAFEGQDWKGAKLRSSDGGEATTVDKAKAAAQAFLEGTIPILAQGERIKDKGVGALNPFAAVKSSTTTSKTTVTEPKASTGSRGEDLLSRAAARGSAAGLSTRQMQLLSRAAQRGGG